MRAVRFLVVAAAIVIAVVIAAVAVLPGFTDWNRYRGSLELLAGEALGRPVTIAGPLSLAVLPEPVLTASRVSVGGGGARITVGELRLKVALLPLLTGEVEARSLTLRHPVFHLVWPPWRGMELSAPWWPTALSARIEDGEIDAGGIVLKHVDATLVGGEGNRALTLIGSAAIGPSTWSLDLKLGEPGLDGAAPFEASLQSGAAQGIAAKVTGRLTSNGGLTGKIALDGPKLSDLMAAPALPFHADGRFMLEHAAIRLDGVAATFGSVSAHGAGTLSLVPGPRLDLVLASQNTVPLDPWLPVLRRGGESRMRVGLSFSAPRATLARGLLQHLDLAIVFGPDGARIGALRATLPGDAAFAAEGRVVPSAPVSGAPAGWQFEGTAHIAAPAALTTMHWLDAAAPGVLPPLPAAALGQAIIGGRVVIGANGIALDDLKGTIDRSKVTGSLSLGLGGRPAISAGLQFDRLDLGRWLPRGFSNRPRGHGFPIAKLPALFKGMTLELRLTAGAASFGRAAMSELSVDAAAESGQVVLRRLDATVDGIHAIASGTIGTAGTVTDGHLALAAAGPQALAKVLPAPFAAAIARWRAGFALDATAAGPPKHLRLTMRAQLGDLRLTASPVLNLDSGTWQGPVSLRDPGAAELLTASGLADPIGWLGPGSLSLIGEAGDGPRGWFLQEFRLNAGLLHISGSLADLDGSEISGRLQASALPIPVPGATLNQLLLGLVGGRRMTLTLASAKVIAGQRVVLEHAEGSLDIGTRQAVIVCNGNVPGGGALALALRVAGGPGPPRFKLGAAVSGIRLQGGLSGGVPDLVAGTLDGEASLTAEGYGPAALLATLGGSIVATVQNGVLSGLSVAGVRSALTGGGDSEEVAGVLAKALAGGRSEFSRLEILARGSTGRFRLVRARMSAGAGVVTADGMFDLPARSEAIRLVVRPAVAEAPDLVVRFGGPMARPKRIEEVNAALQWDARQVGKQRTGRP